MHLILRAKRALDKANAQQWPSDSRSGKLMSGYNEDVCSRGLRVAEAGNRHIYCKDQPDSMQFLKIRWEVQVANRWSGKERFDMSHNVDADPSHHPKRVSLRNSSLARLVQHSWNEGQIKSLVGSYLHQQVPSFRRQKKCLSCRYVSRTMM